MDFSFGIEYNKIIRKENILILTDILCKEMISMKTVAIPTAEESIKMMQDYLEEFRTLKRENPKKAREIAKRELIEIGVLDEKGNPKENIVTGHFFGWD